jgi:hypothetical protein
MSLSPSSSRSLTPIAGSTFSVVSDVSVVGLRTSDGLRCNFGCSFLRSSTVTVPSSSEQARNCSTSGKFV